VGNYVSYASNYSGGTCSIALSGATGQTLTCTLSRLTPTPGTPWQIQVNFYVKGNNKTVTSTASVTTATYDPVPANNTAAWSMSPK